MATNRELLFRIRIRSEAREALRQLNEDLKAQGTSLKQVARETREVQRQAARVGTASAQAGRSVASLASSAKGLADAAKNMTKFVQAMDGAGNKAGVFRNVGQAVRNLDASFRQSQGLVVYANRVRALQASLAALQSQMNATAAAGTALSGLAPPRAPRGSGATGAPPRGTAPPAGGSDGSGCSGAILAPLAGPRIRTASTARSGRHAPQHRHEAVIALGQRPPLPHGRHRRRPQEPGAGDHRQR